MSDLDDMRQKLAWWSESPPARARAGESPPESHVQGSIAAPRATSSLQSPLNHEQITQLALQLAPLLRAPSSQWTFGQIAEEWLKDIRPKRVDPGNESRAIARLKCFTNETEATLLAGAVEEHLERLKLHGKLSGGTINKARSAGRLAIRFAMARGWWTRPNPFEVAKRQKEAKFQALALELHELARLQPYLRADRRREFRVSLHLGLRKGELFGLQKSDVDFARGVIHIRRSHGRNTTKTGKERDVPLLAAIAGDLLEAIQSSPSELVFPNPDGSRQRADTNLCSAIRTAMAAAGVRVEKTTYHCRRCKTKLDDAGMPTERRCGACSMKLWPVPVVAPVRWYDLRHMCVTLHHHHGADRVCVAICVGHSLKGTTEEVYTHPSVAKMRAELSRWLLPA